MAFGEKLRQLRGDKSQEVIAKEVGVTKSSWAMYERNERVPRDEVKIKIAKLNKFLIAHKRHLQNRIINFL